MAAKILHEKIVMEGDFTPIGFATARRIILWVLDITEALLALRFLFRTFGANPATAFTKIVYALSAPLVAPFQGIFSPTFVDGFFIEWSTVIAAAVWLIAAHLLLRLTRTLAAAAQPDA